MRQLLKPFDALILLWLVVFLSCKKEYSGKECPYSTRPSIANAGADQVITLPTDNILLDGTGSSDPCGRISEWQWSKISGPSSYNIENAGAAISLVRNLEQGIYFFELKVSDLGGFSSRDTMQIIVYRDSVYEFKKVVQSPPFYEIDWAIRESVISLPGVNKIIKVFVKWYEGMSWYEPPINCVCYFYPGFATFYNQRLHVFLDAALTDIASDNSSGNYSDYIDVKLFAR